jgi:hypothetical protein
MADNSTAPPATLAAALADRYRIERPNSRIYIPLGSSLLPSFVLSLRCR